MTERKMTFSGRAWLIMDEGGQFVDDIDTDQIFHNAHLAITEISEMGKHAFGNLQGYEHFATEAKPGDIVIVGRNFGAGSSRQQAVDCFASLGVSCILAWSYGAIYKRNAINSGFPILSIRELKQEALKNFDELEVDLKTGKISKAGELVGEAEPFSLVQLDIYKAGNIFEYGKTL